MYLFTENLFIAVVESLLFHLAAKLYLYWYLFYNKVSPERDVTLVARCRLLPLVSYVARVLQTTIDDDRRRR